MKRVSRIASAAIILLAASHTHAAVVYSNTTQTGSRYNPGLGGGGTGTQADVTFDDVPVPNSRLSGMPSLEVTRVTVGVRRAGNAPATDVTLYWATATTTVTAPDTELDAPFNQFHQVSLAARNDTAFITELVTVGDGTTPLFTVPLNTTLASGFGTFMLGLQLSNPDALNGWRITNGPDTNIDAFWDYDSDLANPEATLFFGGNPRATFYIEIEGNPVPEPGTLTLLAGGLALLLRRRIA